MVVLTTICIGLIERIPQSALTVKILETQRLIAECICWNHEKKDLIEAVGANLSLTNIVVRIINDVNCWKAFSLFCAKVMTKKKIAERERERSELEDV